MITRQFAEALIPEEVSKEIFQSVAETSIALRLMRRLPNMNSHQRRLAVLSALPLVYAVDGEAGDYQLSGDENEAGFKQVSQAQWAKKFITAEELATVLPIPIAVLEDADYDIWGELRPHIVAAFGKKIDELVFFAATPTKPFSTWPDGLVPQAIAAGNHLPLGTGDDLYDDLMAEDGLIALVEQDDFFPSAFVAGIPMRGALRGLRDTTSGLPIFRPAIAGAQAGTDYTLDGSPIYFPLNGGWDNGEALMLAGDFAEAVYAIRTDVTYKVLDQAVIQDDQGEIIYNLAQQDMVALRVHMRLGWQVPNPINRAQPDDQYRFPFSVLTPALSSP